MITKHPWWTIVLAICLFPIGLVALLYEHEKRIPMAVVELTAPDGRVTAFQIDADPGHLASTIGA